MSGILKSLFGGGQAGEAAAPPLWLITFTDLMGLMLAFFVLLYAVSSPSGHAWSSLSASFRGEPVTGAQMTGEMAQPQARRTLALAAPGGRLEPAYLSAVLDQNGLAPLGTNGGPVRQMLDGQGSRLVLLADPARFFAGDGMALTPEGAAFAEGLAAVLHYASNPAEIHVKTAHGSEGAVMRDWEQAFGQAAILRDALRAGGYTGDIAISAEVAGSGARTALVIAGKKGARR